MLSCWRRDRGSRGFASRLRLSGCGAHSGALLQRRAGLVFHAGARIVPAAQAGGRGSGDVAGAQREAGAQEHGARRQVRAQGQALGGIGHLQRSDGRQPVAGDAVHVPSAPAAAEVVVGLHVGDVEETQVEIVGHRRAFPRRLPQQGPQGEPIAEAHGDAGPAPSLRGQPLPLLVRHGCGGMDQALQRDGVAQAVVEAKHAAVQVGIVLHQRGVGHLDGGRLQGMVHVARRDPAGAVVGTLEGDAGTQIVAQPHRGLLFRTGPVAALRQSLGSGRLRRAAARGRLGLGRRLPRRRCRARTRAQAAAGQVGRVLPNGAGRAGRQPQQRTPHLREQRQTQGGGIEERAGRIVAGARGGPRRSGGPAVPQPAHPGVAQAQLIDRPRGTPARRQQAGEIGAGVEVPGQVRAARRVFLRGGIESQQRRPVEALLAVAEVGGEFGVREQLHAAGQRDLGQGQVAGQLQTVAQRQRNAEQGGVVPVGASAHRVRGHEAAAEGPDAARTRYPELELERTVLGQRQVSRDAREQAQPGVQVQHQLQVVLVGRRLVGRYAAQKQAAHLLVVLPRSGQTQHRQRFVIRWPAADQVQGGVDEQPLTVAYPEGGTEHHFISGQEEERQVEHRDAAHRKGGPPATPHSPGASSHMRCARTS